MSQAKVDRYKEEKKNRGKVLQKQKREEMLMKAAGAVVAVVLVGWIGFSAYQNVHVEPAHTYQVKTDAMDEYLNSMGETETEAEETESKSEASESEAPETEGAETETSES